MDFISAKLNERLTAASSVEDPASESVFARERKKNPLVWVLVYQDPDLSKYVFKHAIKEMMGLKTFPKIQILIVLAKVPTAGGTKKVSELPPDAHEIGLQQFEISISAVSCFRSLCNTVFPKVHFEINDKVGRGICIAAKKLGATRLFLGYKRGIFSRDKLKNYCMLYKPHNCGLVIFNGPKLEVDMPPESRPDSPVSFSGLPDLSEDSSSDSGFHKDDGSDFSGKLTFPSLSHFDHNALVRLEEVSQELPPAERVISTDPKLERVRRLQNDLSIALKQWEEAKDKAAKLADMSIQSQLKHLDGCNGMKMMRQEIESTIQKAIDAEATVKEIESLLREAMESYKSICSPQVTKAMRGFSGEEVSRACNHFDISLQIGEGPFGIVYKGVYEGTPVAIKKLKNDNSWTAMSKIQKEAETYGFVQHPRIISLKGVCVDPPCFVYELAQEKSLFDYLSNVEEKGYLTWKLRFNLFAEVVSAVKYLHSCDPPIYHVDLKPTNILFDKNYKVKLSDYKISKVWVWMDKGRSFRVLSEAFGTYGYVCPVFRRMGEVNAKTDVYSLGMLLWDLLLGIGSEGNPVLRPWNFQDLIPLVNSKKQSTIMEILDPLPHWPPRIAFQLSRIAAMCVADDLVARPSLSYVGILLNELKDLVQNCNRGKDCSEESCCDNDDGFQDNRNGDDGDNDGGDDDNDYLDDGVDELDYGNSPTINDSDGFTRMLICPISQKIMEDPVIASDGHTYERKSIEKWLCDYDISPITGLPMASKVLIHNKNLHNIIMQLSKRQQQRSDFG